MNYIGFLRARILQTMNRRKNGLFHVKQAMRSLQNRRVYANF